MALYMWVDLYRVQTCGQARMFFDHLRNGVHPQFVFSILLYKNIPKTSLDGHNCVKKIIAQLSDLLSHRRTKFVLPETSLIII